MSLIESQQNIAIASQEEVIASQVEQVEVPQSNMSANETTEEQQQAASETASSPEAAEDVESFASSSSDSDSENEAEEEPESKTCRNLTVGGLVAALAVGAVCIYKYSAKINECCCAPKKTDEGDVDETKVKRQGSDNHENGEKKFQRRTGNNKEEQSDEEDLKQSMEDTQESIAEEAVPRDVHEAYLLNREIEKQEKIREYKEGMKKAEWKMAVNRLFNKAGSFEEARKALKAMNVAQLRALYQTYEAAVDQSAKKSEEMAKKKDMAKLAEEMDGKRQEDPKSYNHLTKQAFVEEYLQWAQTQIAEEGKANIAHRGQS